MVFAVSFIFLFAVSANFYLVKAENEDPTGSESPSATILKDRVNVKKTLSEDLSEARNQARETREEIKENREENVEKRCEIVTERVNNRVTVATTNKKKHVEFYNNAKNKISEFVDKLTEEGYDTSVLKSELVVLESLIIDLSAKYDSFILSLEETNQYSCGNSEGDFVSSLQEARAAFLEVRQAAIAIRDQYTGKIRPLIKELRSQTKQELESEVENE